MTRKEHRNNRSLLMPVYNKVGYYAAFVHREEDIKEIMEAVLKDHCLIDCVYFVDNDLTLPESLQLPCRHITSAEEKVILSGQFVPLWVADQAIFDDVLCGRHVAAMPRSAEVVPCFSCEKCAYKCVKQQMNLWHGSGNDNNAHEQNTRGAVTTKMDVQTAKTVMEKLHEAGVTEVSITGGGEPLCNIPATLCCLEEARKYGMDIGLYTNGFFLDKCCADLIRANPSFIRVSVYGFTPDAFSRYTGSPKSNYARVIDNIKRLTQIRDAEGSSTKILLSMLISPDLTDRPERLEGFLNRFDAQTLASLNGIRFTPLINYENNDLQMSRDYLERFFACVDTYKAEHPYPSIVCFKHRMEMYESKPYTGCAGSALYIEVGPDAGVYFCCEHNLKPDYRIGDLLKESVADIWSRQTEKRCGMDTSQCPKVCKPHEYNKFIYQVAGLCDTEAILNWGNALRMSESSGRVA